MKGKDLANTITASILIQVPKLYPEMRLWRHNTGSGIGMSTVKQAVSMMRSGQVQKAISLLLTRPIKWGLVGSSDIIGLWTIDTGQPCGQIARFVAIEIKAEGDSLTEEQINFGKQVILMGGVHVIAKSVDQCIEDLGRWAL